MAEDNQVKQGEINALIWKTCATFRGTIDPTMYKDYILVFLFLKYLSDVWKEKKEAYEKQFGKNPERIERKLSRERFVLEDHCTFDYIYENRDKSNIGELINIALERIEEKNKMKLDGVFRNIDFNSEPNLGQTKDRNRRLKSLIEDFHNPRLDFRPSKIGNMDVIGNAYEYLISRFASDAGKKGGEFYTPPEVAILLAKLLEPKSGDRISDPACGSGSLLIRVANDVKDRNFSVCGQENNGSTWALCKMNMFLHGIDNARIEWGDTLNNPKLLKDDELMKFNVVVANPPFSLDKWGAEHAAGDRYRRFQRGVPPKSKGDYAFILHMIETMVEEDGRVGVIAPHGVLFRAGSEGKIRQQLIKENLLDAVIGLPANLFFGTGIPAVILLFKKNRKKKDVLFIDASREFNKDKAQNKLGEDQIDRIVKTYKSNKTVEKYAYRCGSDEMIENEYNLNIPRYVDTFEEESLVDLSSVKKEINRLESKLIQIKDTISEHLKELNV